MANLAKHKILTFEHLATGWCFGEGISFSKAILKTALELYDTSQLAGFNSTDAFPALDGGITLSLYVGNHYYEFTIEPDFLVTYYHEIDDETHEYIERLSIPDTKQKIAEIGLTSWFTYELSPRIFMISTKIESKAMLSKKQAMENYLLLKKIASPPLKKAYANISEPTIKIKTLIHPCIGNSRKNIYRMVVI